MVEVWGHQTPPSRALERMSKYTISGFSTPWQLAPLKSHIVQFAVFLENKNEKDRSYIRENEFDREFVTTFMIRE